MKHLAAIGPDVQRFAGKTVLLTGAAGFLGRHFLDTFAYMNLYVLRTPCRVIAVDNYITGAPKLVGGDAILPVWADVAYPLPIREPVHFIISAAGIASPVYYHKFPLETIRATVVGVQKMLELARDQKDFEAFIYFSSSEIYGDPTRDAIPTPETYNGNVSCTGPRACYDESKRLGETLVSIYHQHFGVPAKVIRPFNVIGPGMAHNDQRVVPMFTYEALHKRPLPIFRDGLQTRTFCDITDAMTGFLKVLLQGKPGEAYNIGNPNNEISMADLGHKFEKKLGAELSFVPYPDAYPNEEPLRRCPNIFKAAHFLGYSPVTDLDEALDKFIAWASVDPGYTR